LSLDSNSWQLTKTNSNGHKKQGYKLSSMGYSYTVDKPKTEDIQTASKIYWKCERLSSGPIENRCHGRAQSNGLQPPVTITKAHNHTPAPERVEVLKIRENIKQMGMSTNDNPRTILRENALHLTDAVISSLTRKDAFRQLILRTRNFKAGHGFTAKCLSEIEIPNNLR
jgi:hypothetical protein